MTKNATITYFPVFDFVVFLLALATLLIAYFISSISLWILTPLAFFSYIITIAKARIIKLNIDKLNIISLNPFFRSHSINLTSITKIKSSESYEHETVVTDEVYPIFNKNYEIEYLDKNGRKKIALFSINNKGKEEKIISVLKKNSSQGI